MEKQEFKEKASKSIDDIYAKIEALKLKKENAEKEIKESIDAQIHKLEAQKQVMEDKYKQLIDSADHKWDEVKEAFSASAGSFKEGFAKIFSVFEKKEE